MIISALLCSLCAGGAFAEDALIQPPSSSTAVVSVSTAAVAPEVSAEKQKVLNEMWKRRILGPESNAWSADDYALLERMRDAESLNAFGLLREHMGTLRGCVVRYGSNSMDRRLWLTKTGFEQYIFIKSQLARKYFEDQGTDAKFVFKLLDLKGRHLFDGKGLLASAGDVLYNQILRGESVQWRDAAGRIVGNTHVPAQP